MNEVTRKVRYLMYADVDPNSEANAKRLAELFEWLEKQKTKAGEDEGKKREEDEKSRIQRLINEYEKQNEAVKQNNREMHDGLLKTGEGVVTLSRGLAELGVVQEKDAEQMLKLVVQIQAGVDIAKGLIDSYRGAAAMVESYRAAVIAATIAEESLAVARTKSAGAAGLGSAGAAVTASTATAAGGSLAPLATGMSALTAAIFSLPGAIALALTGVGAAGVMAFNVGGSRDRAANAIDEFGRSSSWAGWAVETGNYGLGIGDYLVNPYSDIDDSGSLASLQRKAYSGKADTEQQIAQRQAGLDMFGRQNGAAQDQFDLRQMVAERAYANRQLMIGAVSPGDGAAMTGELLSSAMNDLQAARQNSAAAAAMPAGMMRGAEMERAAQAEVNAVNRVIALRQQALGLERQASNERLAGVKKETAELQRQLDLAKKQGEEADNRLKSAKERFGALDEATQRRIIAAKQKADAQGATSLSREERALLRGVGTKGAAGLASEGDIASADALGFDNVFGSEERQASALAASTQATVEAKLKVQRELKVSIEDDVEALAERTGNYLAELLEQRETILAQKILQQIEKRSIERNQKPTPGQTSIGG